MLSYSHVPSINRGLGELSENHSQDNVIKCSLGQLELGGYFNHPQGNEQRKDIHPLGSTEVPGVSMLCEAKKDSVQGKGVE